MGERRMRSLYGVWLVDCQDKEEGVRVHVHGLSFGR